MVGAELREVAKVSDVIMIVARYVQATQQQSNVEIVCGKDVANAFSAETSFSLSVSSFMLCDILQRRNFFPKFSSKMGPIVVLNI